MANDENRSLTLRDVSEASGVSEMTVSRVLRNRGDVSAATRERVLKAAKELTEAVGDGENMDAEKVAHLANTHAATLRRLVDMASGIINGHGIRTHQEDIDAILEDEAGDDGISQDEIDAMFG